MTNASGSSGSDQTGSGSTPKEERQRFLCVHCLEDGQSIALYADENSLRKHQGRIHNCWNAPRSVVCKKCGKGFDSQGIPREHLAMSDCNAREHKRQWKPQPAVDDWQRRADIWATAGRDGKRIQRALIAEPGEVVYDTERQPRLERVRWTYANPGAPRSSVGGRRPAPQGNGPIAGPAYPRNLQPAQSSAGAAGFPGAATGASVAETGAWAEEQLYPQQHMGHMQHMPTQPRTAHHAPVERPQSTNMPRQQDPWQMMGYAQHPQAAQPTARHAGFGMQQSTNMLGQHDPRQIMGYAQHQQAAQQTASHAGFGMSQGTNMPGPQYPQQNGGYTQQRPTTAQMAGYLSSRMRRSTHMPARQYLQQNGGYAQQQQPARQMGQHPPFGMLQGSDMPGQQYFQGPGMNEYFADELPPSFPASESEGMYHGGIPPQQQYLGAPQRSFGHPALRPPGPLAANHREIGPTARAAAQAQSLALSRSLHGIQQLEGYYSNGSLGYGAGGNMSARMAPPRPSTQAPRKRKLPGDWEQQAMRSEPTFGSPGSGLESLGPMNHHPDSGYGSGQFCNSDDEVDLAGMPARNPAMGLSAPTMASEQHPTMPQTPYVGAFDGLRGAMDFADPGMQQELWNDAVTQQAASAPAVASRRRPIPAQMRDARPTNVFSRTMDLDCLEIQQGGHTPMSYDAGAEPASSAPASTSAQDPTPAQTTHVDTADEFDGLIDFDGPEIQQSIYNSLSNSFPAGSDSSAPPLPSTQDPEPTDTLPHGSADDFGAANGPTLPAMEDSEELSAQPFDEEDFARTLIYYHGTHDSQDREI